MEDYLFTDVQYIPFSPKKRIKRIASLHQESRLIIELTTRILLRNAIEAGILLLQQKDSLPHGEFAVWIAKNKDRLGFGERQVQCYVKIARRKEELLRSQASNMEDALLFLTSSHCDTSEENNSVFEMNTSSTPNLPTESDTGIVSESLHSVSESDTDSDIELSAREECEVAAMVAELGMLETEARQIVVWRKGKQQKEKKAVTKNIPLERSTPDLPSPVQQQVQNEAKLQGISESEILQNILKLYYPDSQM